MARPDVEIIESNNNLGRLPASTDGVMGHVLSGVAITGQFALGDTIGPYRSIKEVEAVGITKQWDVTNKCMVWHHANEFFLEANGPTPLYMMVVAKTVTMEDICDETMAYARKFANDTQGKVNIIGVSRVPDASYTATSVDGLDPDVMLAVAKAKVLRETLFKEHKPLRFVIEGRGFTGVVADLADLRDPATGPNANSVGVVLGQAKEVGAEDASFLGYAFVGRVLGRMARIPVQRNIARVKDGPLIGVSTAALSGGMAVQSLTNIQLDVLHDYGYIYGLFYPNLPDYYFNNGSTACPISDDYNSLHRGRTMDKVSRITYLTYITQVQDDVEVDRTSGKLPISVCKVFESLLQTAIETQMVGEISGVKTYVDPDQNVNGTGVLEVQNSVVPRGTLEKIKVTEGYALSLGQ